MSTRPFPVSLAFLIAAMPAFAFAGYISYLIVPIILREVVPTVVVSVVGS